MISIDILLTLATFIYRFSYEPEPDAEEELSIQAGDYLLVWGEPVGPGGYLDAELLDGRRGLVPSHFVQRLIGKNISKIDFGKVSSDCCRFFKVMICLNFIRQS